MPDKQILTKHFPILRAENGVHFLTEPESDFEKIYLEARKREGWLATDEALRALPDTHSDDPHASVWNLRKQSLNRFVHYVRGMSQSPRHILEVGCGNGWFSHALAGQLKGTTVMGLDINLQELQQAARVFGATNPVWFYGDLFTALLPERFFEIIVFNGAIQYFSDLRAVFDRLLPSLAQEGEIHILDSPLYHPKQLAEAKERTTAHYAQLGVNAMISYYHAHATEALATYHPEYLHNPDSFANRLRGIVGQTVNPMPWIKLRP